MKDPREISDPSPWNIATVSVNYNPHLQEHVPAFLAAPNTTTINQTLLVQPIFTNHNLKVQCPLPLTLDSKWYDERLCKGTLSQAVAQEVERVTLLPQVQQFDLGLSPSACQSVLGQHTESQIAKLYWKVLRMVIKSIKHIIFTFFI